MTDKFTDKLLLRCLQGKAAEKEYEIAYKWIHSDKSNLEYYESLRDAWVAAGIVTSKNEVDCCKAWRKVSRRTGIKWINMPRIYTTWSRIAAVFVIAFICGTLTYHLLWDFSPFSPATGVSEYIVEAPLGSKSLIILSDSTRVWLNAGSSLRYTTSYDVKERDVYLRGEGYFDVAANQKLPFRVHASDLLIHSLGTEFNVKAYPEEETVETTLVSGIVRLERKTPEGETEKVLLRPNQRASFAQKTKTIKVDYVSDDTVAGELEGPDIKPVIKAAPIKAAPDAPEKIAIEPVFNTSIYTSWKDKRFVFERESMSDLAVKLERIYDVKIIFKDEELKDYNLTGSLEQETLEQLLNAVRLTIPLDFSIEKNNVVLTMNQELKERYNKI